VQSVQSRIESLPKFGLVLVDEAHHVGAQMFRDTIQQLQPKMLGGVTATPWRGDGYDIDQLLGPPLVRMGIAEGLQNGFFVRGGLSFDGRQPRLAVHPRSLALSVLAFAAKSQTHHSIRDEQAARIIREVFEGTKGVAESFTARRQFTHSLFAGCSVIMASALNPSRTKHQRVNATY